MSEVTIRPADPERDADLIQAVDTSFETSTIFEVIRDGLGFRLAEAPVDPPVRKVFPLDDFADGRRWDRAWLALAGVAPVGFVATEVSDWNHRAVVWHLYVSAAYRRGGSDGTPTSGEVALFLERPL